MLLERALPGVNLYVGLLRPGGNQLTFVAATAKSRMSGKVLQRGDGGVSFDCLGPGYAKNGVRKQENVCLRTVHQSRTLVCFYLHAWVYC